MTGANFDVVNFCPDPQASGGTIAASGTGNITINGRGSIGGISRAGVAFDPNTTVSTNTGDVTIGGVGGTSTGAQSNGFQVHQGSLVESTGGGSIDITGTAGSEVNEFATLMPLLSPRNPPAATVTAPVPSALSAKMRPVLPAGIVVPPP